MASSLKSLFKKIQQIKIRTEHLATDMLAGAYKSAFKGRGIEFEEVREYQNGDDIRSIDWNVTARMAHPYIKNFQEERELTVTLAVDVSASTRFGSGNNLKSDLIAEIAAAIAFSAIRNNDQIALILFSDHVEKYLAPKKGTRHVLRIVRELLSFQPSDKGTDIAEALSFLGKVQKRSGICFLLSDFISPDFSHQATIISGRQDLVPLLFVDPAETELPQMNVVCIQDPESGAIGYVDMASQETRQGLTKKTEEHIIQQKKLMQKLGTACCVLRTDKDYIPQLQKYFALRKERFR